MNDRNESKAEDVDQETEAPIKTLKLRKTTLKNLKSLRSGIKTGFVISTGHQG